MVCWRQVTGDAFAGCPGVFTISVTIFASYFLVTPDKRVEAMVKVLVNELHGLEVYSNWIGAFRLDDGRKLARAGCVAQGQHFV